MKGANHYFSVLHPGESIFRDRGSRFLAFIFPVSSEDEIKGLLQKIRHEHHGANHVCYAWRLGAEKTSYRANDDGEPSGTAGKPIFGQIQSYDLSNVLIAVVRYFGGTLLGKGGLIHAYRSAAEAAIKNSVIVEKHIHLQFLVEFDSGQLSHVMRILKLNNCTIAQQNYEERHSIRFSAKRSVAGRCSEQLSALPFLTLTTL